LYHIFTNEIELPTINDLQGALAGLARLQITYSLDVFSIIDGTYSSDTFAYRSLNCM
jgi:hypothetical protein